MGMVVAVAMGGGERGVDAARIPGAPYPTAAAGLNCAGSLYVVDQTTLSDDDQVTVNAIMGATARTCPRVYVTQGPGSSYAAFLTELTAAFPALVLNNTYLNNSAAGLLAACADVFTGYAIVNLTDGSVASGYTLAAARPVVLVTANNEAAATAVGLPLVADLTGVPVSTVLATYNTSAGAWSPRIAALQLPAKFGYLGDYTIFGGGIMWWDTNMSSALTTTVLSSLAGPAAIFGWGADEPSTVTAASVYDAYVHASDWSLNLATLTNFEVAATFRQSAPRPAPPPAARHTVCFLMTDGDNIQWLEGGMPFNAAWWGSPDRGSVSLGWTLSPALRDLANVIQAYMYSTATNTSTARDVFVSAPSGIGYLYPDLMSPSALASVVNLTAAYAAANDASIVNIIGMNYAQAAASVYTAAPEVSALLWYDYAVYQALGGNITFVNGKPVIGARFQLWSGEFDTPATLIPKLLAQPKTPGSPAGYSLIPVHVWTNNVTDVRTVADALAAAGGFAVLPPDEFVAAIAANLPH